MSDQNSASGDQHDEVAGAARPPAFPTVDREHPGTIWRPASDELLTPTATPTPVTERVAGGPRTPMWRWLVALVATIAVVGVVSAVGYLAIHRAGAPSAVSHYAPAGTAMYEEINLNLPGDQHDQLASFLGHFPGFADPSSFQQKLDDTLNQLLVSSGSGLTWDQDVAPWFGNEVAVFGNPWASMAMVNATPGTGMVTTMPYVVALSVTDRSQLEQLMNPRLSDAKASSSQYDGETLWTIPDASVDVAVTGDALLVGDEQDVKAALDAQTGRQPSLADDDFYLQQLASLHADRLGTMYVDYGAMVQAMADSLGSSSALPGMSSLDWLSQLGSGSGKFVAEVRAEGDHLAVNSRAAHPSGENVAPLPSNRHTALAERMPADALLYFETRDFGQAVKYMFNRLQSLSPSASGAPDMSLQSIGEMLGTPAQDYLDFVQDVGVSVDYANGKLGVGLVATVDDENVARTRVTQLLSMVRLAAGSGSGMSVDEQQHGDVTITVLHITGSSPALPGMATLPGAGMPDIALGVAVANGQLLIGLDDFVANALDRQAADSLAANPKFKAAAATAGDNSGIGFLDIAGIRSALEQAMPAGADRTDYEQNVKPFLAPLNYVLWYGVTDGDISEGHVFLYVE